MSEPALSLPTGGLEETIAAWNGLGVVCRFDAPTGTWIFICLHDNTLGTPTGGSRMKVYPSLADRSSPDAWTEEGRPKLRDKARARVAEILATHRTAPFAEGAEEKIRSMLPIRLPAHLVAGNFGE